MTFRFPKTKLELGVLGFAISYLALWLTNVSSKLFGWDLPEFSWLEFAAVTTSYICTLLATQQFRAQYYWGVVTTALYCWLFWRVGLPASAILNLVLSIQLVYGFFRWGPDDDTIAVTKTKLREWPLYILATGALYGLTLLVLHWMDTPRAPFLDSLILALSILAQWLLDNKKIETWFVWMAVNVIAIYTYFSSDLWLAGWQYIFFLMNCFVGYNLWHKDIKGTKAVANLS